MKKVVFVLLVTFLIAFNGLNYSLAGAPTGLEKQGKKPPGFNEGEKEGWDNEYPPGWNKKSNRQKFKQEDKDIIKIEIEPLEVDYEKNKSNGKYKKKKKKGIIDSGAD